jgi:hypothetical protein
MAAADRAEQRSGGAGKRVEEKTVPTVLSEAFNSQSLLCARYLPCAARKDTRRTSDLGFPLLFFAVC